MKSSQVVVSLRSRGIPSFNVSNLINVHAQLLQLFTEATDILAAALITITSYSWTAWISIIIMVFVLSIDNTQNDKKNPDTAVFFPLFAFVFLPLILLLYFVITRRDRAQAALAKFKVSFVGLKLQAAALSNPVPPSPRYSFNDANVHHTVDMIKATAATGQAGLMNSQNGMVQLPPVSGSAAAAGVPAVSAAAEDLQKVLLLLLGDLHKYLAHKRPYARHFYMPYRPDRIKADTLYKVSRQMGLLMRRVQRSMRETIVHVGCLREALFTGPALSTSTTTQQPAADLPAPAGMQPSALHQHVQAQQLLAVGGAASSATATSILLGQQVCDLHTAVEQLMAVKEQHTPVILRAAVRWITVILVPVFLGYYWLMTMRNVSYAVGGIMGIVCHLAVMSLLDTAISLEDPFDEIALDAVSCLEAIEGAAVMSTASDIDRQTWLYSRDDGVDDDNTHHGHAAATATNNQHPNTTSSGSEAGGRGGIPIVTVVQPVAMPPVPPPPAPLAVAGAGYLPSAT